MKGAAPLLAFTTMAAQPLAVPDGARLDRRKGLDRAWDRFILDGTLSPSIRDDIAQSWLRTQAAGVIPSLARPKEGMSGSALEALRRRDDALRLVQPLFDEFSDSLAGHVIAYFDAQGTMLAIHGDPDVIARLAEDIHFGPGSNWSEASAGTNGPGTALFARKPVEVFASEHLVQAWQAWSCAAAPFMVPGDAAPAGVIDVTGPWEVQSRQALTMARAVARTVEERLRASVSLRDEVIRHALRAARDACEALVAVDTKGRVLGMNDAATRRHLLEHGALPGGMQEVLFRLFAPGGMGTQEVSVRGAQGPAFTAAPVHYDGSAVGAILRVPLVGRPRASPPTQAQAHEPVPQARYDFGTIIGQSPAITAAVELARVASHSDLPVVLLGESGTGKELFAHSIHAASRRAQGPFVVVNCGSIPAELIEAELFGYEAGAFTGARKGGAAGRFEDAIGGTIFLDEVSDLPAHAQVALLRVLQEKEVVRIGASRPLPVDVRVLAATNRPLDAETQTGRFRLDLYFRLSVLRIAIPSLRERGDDLRELAERFLREAEAEVGRSGLALAPCALDVLYAHRWPGNVRELKNVILRAATMAASPRIGAGDLSLDFADGIPTPAQPMSLPASAPAPAPSAATLKEVVLTSEKSRVIEVLGMTGWNVARSAQQLGVSRMTMYRLLHKYGLSREGRAP